MNQQNLWTNFENHLLNESVSDNRKTKLKQMFLTCERGLNKSYEECTREHIEDFINRLNRNEFLKLNNKKYTGTSKADIKKFLRQFYKWYKGNNETYPLEVSWIKTRISKDEQPEDKPVLSIQEVTKLANGFKRAEYRILVLMLFDSGFRIHEMQSIKKKDLTWESFTQEQEKCFWVMCNESKTITRKIPIPLFTEDIQTFVNSSYYKSLSEDDLVFPMSYSNILTLFKEKSVKLLGKGISPHALRHSSATYYSKEYDGNMNLIASRYGWSFSSKELKTYIRRSGAYERQGAKKIYENQNVELQKQMNVLKKDNEKLNNQVKVMMAYMKKQDAFMKHIETRTKAF